MNMCDTDDVAEAVGMGELNMLHLWKTLKWKGHKKMEHLKLMQEVTLSISILRHLCLRLVRDT